MKKSLITVLFLIFSFAVNGQINIEFPYNYMVVQRNLNNNADVLVCGNTTDKADKILVRFVPKKTEWGTYSDWKECNLIKKDNLIGFSVLTTINGGWYEIEVKTLNGTKELTTKKIENFGVGEVFLIAGQSNASGQSDSNQKNAVDDRVVTISAYDLNLASVPSNNFSKLLNYLQIYPSGNGSWCWSELGDKLVQKLNVPVMFLNAAWGGSSSFDWKKSITNTAERDYARREVPYLFLKRTLQYYANITGFRGVLWHQGESDNGIGETKVKTSTQDYFDNVSAVIQESRSQTNHPLSWVVSRVSYGLGINSEDVITAQNKLISDLKNVYGGPSTDDMKDKYRNDDLHFTNKNGKTGLTELANRWDKSLDDTFFKNALPKTPNQTLLTTSNCLESITYPAGLTEKNWGNKYSSHNFLIDKNENYYVSSIVANQVVRKLKTTATNSIVCELKKVILTATNDGGEAVLWSNGLTGKSITVAYEGTYSAILQNKNTCYIDVPSDDIVLRNAGLVKLNQTPKITSSNASITCQSNPAVLSVVTPSNLEVVWNTGFVGSNYYVGNGGDYFAYFREKDGCQSSINSDIYSIKDISSIELPSITKDKNFACQGEEIQLKVPVNYEVNWSNGKTENPTKVSQSGDYSYKLKIPNGCTTNSSAVLKINFALAPPEVIEIKRILNDNIEAILSTPANNVLYEWKLNDTLLVNNTSIISIKKQGVYKVKSFFDYGNNAKCYAIGNQSKSYITNATEQDGNFIIYPNPSILGEKVEISVLNSTDIFKVEIVSIDGKVISKLEWNTANSLIISTLQSGSYIIKLKSANKTYTSRIVIL